MDCNNSEDVYENQEDLDASEPVPLLKRFRGAGREWKKEREFNSAQKAVSAFKTEKCWSIANRYDTRDGMKVQYRCNRIKDGGKNCPAAVYLYYHADRENVTLYRAVFEHEHEGKLPARGLSEDIRQAVSELYEEGVKTVKGIWSALDTHSLPQPPLNQIRSFLQYYKRIHEGPARMNLGQFEQWCLSNSTPDLDDMDASYVVRHESFEKEDGKGALRVFMTTPRLLRIACTSNIVQADATYKLNYEGFPCIIVDTTDRDRHFHPTGLAVTVGESATDFAFVFGALASAVESQCQCEYRPDVLVADAAEAITNGFAEVFRDGFQRVTCWAHVKRAVDRRLKKIVNVEQRDQLLNDIRELQACESKEIFESVSELFFEKWEAIGNADVTGFLNYFKHEWLTGRKHWYEGYTPSAPSTNNALESTNCRIKQEGTLRHRLPIARFLTLAKDHLLRTWSRERDTSKPFAKSFAYTPTKTTAVWTKSWQWAKAHNIPFMRKVAPDNSMKYYVPMSMDPGGYSPTLVRNYIATFSTMSWREFNRYAYFRNQLAVVSVCDGIWDSTECNCPMFLKEYQCYHSLGVPIKFGGVRVPAVAQTVPVGEKRKRGRPCMATSALKRD